MSTISNEGVVLYSYWRSSCSWRVRIALNLKGISYETRIVSLIKDGGQHHADEYKKLNPMEQVPALLIDGHTLIESLSIIHYLEETRPEHPLLPEDAYSRAKVRAICDVIASGTQPLQNMVVLKKIGDQKMDWGRHWITRGFDALEQLLSASAGKYCVGDAITIADCCLVPQIYNARRFAVDLSPYPNIVRIDGNLESHPAFLKAHPNEQPDFQPEASS